MVSSVHVVLGVDRGVTLLQGGASAPCEVNPLSRSRSLREPGTGDKGRADPCKSLRTRGSGQSEAVEGNQGTFVTLQVKNDQQKGPASNVRGTRQEQTAELQTAELPIHQHLHEIYLDVTRRHRAQQASGLFFLRNGCPRTCSHQVSLGFLTPIPQQYGPFDIAGLSHDDPDIFPFILARRDDRQIKPGLAAGNLEKQAGLSLTPR